MLNPWKAKVTDPKIEGKTADEGLGAAAPLGGLPAGTTLPAPGGLVDGAVETEVMADKERP